jgi:hypothetical protein
MTIRSRDEQRAIEAHRIMLSIQLHCHLLNLAREAKEGPAQERIAKLQEFQQFIQYAHAKMKLQVLAAIEGEEITQEEEEND